MVSSRNISATSAYQRRVVPNAHKGGDRERDTAQLHDVITAGQYVDDPVALWPIREDVERARRQLIAAMDEGVKKLLDFSQTPSTTRPALKDWLYCTFLSDLLINVYGEKTEETLLDVVQTKTGLSSLPLHHLLNALLAAAISEWVLENQDDMMPPEPTERTMTFLERVYAQSMPDFYFRLSRSTADIIVLQGFPSSISSVSWTEDASTSKRAWMGPHHKALDGTLSPSHAGFHDV